MVALDVSDRGTLHGLAACTEFASSAALRDPAGTVCMAGCSETSSGAVSGAVRKDRGRASSAGRAHWHPQAAGSAWGLIGSSTPTSLNRPDPLLVPDSMSAARIIAAAVQLLRSAGKWSLLTYCQPVQ
jgi:hypothetical protein